MINLSIIMIWSSKMDIIEDGIVSITYEGMEVAEQYNNEGKMLVEGYSAGVYVK